MGGWRTRFHRAKLRRWVEDLMEINFLDRLGKVLQETGTKCFVWVLIPNTFTFSLDTKA